MSVKIDISVSDKASAPLKKLADSQAMRGRLVRRLGPAWARAANNVVGSAARHRFTGQGPFPPAQNKLGVVTQRLRKSLRATAPQVNAATGEVSITMGSNVSYFAVHEFGFRGKVQVRGHARRLIGTGKIRGGKFSKKSQRELVERRRGRVKTIAQVRPHSRRMKVPARAPLGTEIRSLRGRGEFYKAQKQAVLAVTREVNP